MSLREKVEGEIRERGPIPFSRYVELCLYDPADGYYSRPDERFGKAGDFYTSSDVHAVFGRLLARRFDEIWRVLDRPPQIEILELGPGRGLFARDVLDWSNKRFPDFFGAITYTLQESSPGLRARLRENLGEHVTSGKAHVAGTARTSPTHVGARALTRPAEQSSAPASIQRTLGSDAHLIVFANEFFDALPVEILSTQGKLHLALENSRLQEIWLPPLAQELEFLDRYGVHPEPSERIEIPVVAQDWIREIVHTSAPAPLLIIVIDYGYTREQQLAGRHRGTLMAYRHHSASPDPYQAPGEQDLTAHVNFTALAAVCEQSGMRCEKLFTQSQFLMSIGEKNQFADAFEDCRLPQERAKVALQLKHLVAPVGVGENFQVLMASRGVETRKIAAMSGLGFGSGFESPRIAEQS